MIVPDLSYLLEYLLILFDVRVWTSNITYSYCVASDYYHIISVFIGGENLSVRN